MYVIFLLKRVIIIVIKMTKEVDFVHNNNNNNNKIVCKKIDFDKSLKNIPFVEVGNVLLLNNNFQHTKTTYHFQKFSLNVLKP
jgi:hypothetical protein